MGGQFRNRRSATPEDRLERSHSKIRERLDELISTAEAFDAEPSAARDELLEIVSFFQNSVLRHELDEEESVFPRLSTHPALRSVLDQLRADHRIFSKYLARLDALLAKSKPVVPITPLCRDIQRGYLDHIKLEDRQLLPAVRRHLSESEKAEVVDEMLARRGHA